MNFKCYQSKLNLECGYPVSKCTCHLLNVNLFGKIFNFALTVMEIIKKVVPWSRRFFLIFLHENEPQSGWRDGAALQDM